MRQKQHKHLKGSGGHEILKENDEMFFEKSEGKKTIWQKAWWTLSCKVTWKIGNVPKDLENLTKILFQAKTKYATWLFLVEYIKCENRQVRKMGKV